MRNEDCRVAPSTVSMAISATAEGPGSAQSSRARVVLLVLAALAPAVFALVTNNVWEDFFITFRCSLNLVHGDGLVYEAGRTVHTFTSPLGTLLPGAISWLFHTESPQSVIDIFRVVACLALVLAWRLAASRIDGSVALAMTAALWLLDAKLAAFSTNGMETAFLVLFVVLAWRSIVDADMRLAGIAFGGAMWTRPDGFVFVGALAAAAWLLQDVRRWNWPGWSRLVGWGACIYAPWFFWAWWYYGSPVPHTILAKKTIALEVDWASVLLSWPIRLIFGRTAADDAFMPPYFYFGDWPKLLWWWSKAMTLGTIVAVSWPRCARSSRVAALAFLLGGFYLELTPLAPWYFPAWQVLAYIAIGGLIAALAGVTIAAKSVGKAMLAIFATFLILTQGLVYLAVSVQLREQQRLIETGLRSVIGHDLRGLAISPRDTVFLEPLGYIGFYSGLAMRDTPGLCAPEVAALRRAGLKTMGALAVALKTDWVVLRGYEYKAMSAEENARFSQLYDFVGDYDMRRQVEAVEYLPGRGFLRYDAHFLIWRLHQRSTLQ